MAEGLASISNTSIMDQKPKSVSDYHREIKPPSSWGVGAKRKRQGLLKGSQTQTDLWARPTEEGLQPQELTLLTDPCAYKLPSRPLCSLWVGIPHLSLSRNPGQPEREGGKRREAQEPRLPTKRPAPTRRTQLREDEKHFIV